MSHIEEDEEDLDLKVGRDCVVEPGKLSLLESRILKRVKEEFGVVGENGFLGLRGFQNMRNVYDWNSLKLEVDVTQINFGTLYKIECESVDPEEAKRILEEFLWSYTFVVDHLRIKMIRFTDVIVQMSLIFHFN